MFRFRHLALIFLFLSPVVAADEVPLVGALSLAMWIARVACRTVVYTPSGPLLDTFAQIRGDMSMFCDFIDT
jgi:hypothetical protein